MITFTPPFVLDEEHGEVTFANGTEPVHAAADCHLDPCPFHTPTDHPLAQAPMIFDRARRQPRRLCVHEEDHPDADWVAFRAGQGAHLPHECACGCCGLEPVRLGDGQVEMLSPGMAGKWRVLTQGSTHIWDLAVMTWERYPGDESHAGVMEFDGQAHRIARVDAWPVVGGTSLVWFDDPNHPFTHETWRRSSTIRCIERIAA